MQGCIAARRSGSKDSTVELGDCFFVGCWNVVHGNLLIPHVCFNPMSLKLSVIVLRDLEVVIRR